MAVGIEKRLLVYARDGYRCVHCGGTCALTIDHRYPRAFGGDDALDNLQTLCQTCNWAKGCLYPWPIADVAHFDNDCPAEVAAVYWQRLALREWQAHCYLCNQGQEACCCSSRGEAISLTLSYRYEWVVEVDILDEAPHDDCNLLPC